MRESARTAAKCYFTRFKRYTATFKAVKKHMLPPMPGSRTGLIVIVAFLAGAFSACSPEKIPAVYRIDIQQGNVITQEMLDQLEPGMERRKVRYILGTPMLTDTFNESRWDYYYSYTQGTSQPVRRRISVFFEGDKLARIEGDIRPANVRRSVSPRKETIVTVPPDTEGEGIFSALKPDFIGGKKKPPPLVDPSEPAAPSSPEGKTEGETPADDASAVTAASASPAPVPEPSPRDEQYLERLFQGFGKGGTSSGSGSAAYDNNGPESSGASGTGKSDDTTAGGDGFIKRLINRLRQTTDTDSTDSDPADSSRTDTPPPGPEPAAP